MYWPGLLVADHSMAFLNKCYRLRHRIRKIYHDSDFKETVVKNFELIYVVVLYVTQVLLMSVSVLSSSIVYFGKPKGHLWGKSCTRLTVHFII